MSLLCHCMSSQQCSLVNQTIFFWECACPPPFSMRMHVPRKRRSGSRDYQACTLCLFCICRVFKQHLEKSWRQLSKSWVRTNLFSNASLIHLLCLLFQFIFFFQLPWLPEVLLSLQDYQFLDDLFTSKHSVIY